MCIFMMKDKTKKMKKTPEQKEKSMNTLVKKFSESEAGQLWLDSFNVHTDK